MQILQAPKYPGDDCKFSLTDEEITELEEKILDYMSNYFCGDMVDAGYFKVYRLIQGGWIKTDKVFSSYTMDFIKKLLNITENKPE